MPAKKEKTFSVFLPERELKLGKLFAWWDISYHEHVQMLSNIANNYLAKKEYENFEITTQIISKYQAIWEEFTNTMYSDTNT